MKKRTEAFSVLLSATFLLYFWGGKGRLFSKKIDLFPPKNIIKMLHSTRLKKLLYVSSFICLLCVCKISLDLIERILLYVYLTEHPEIQDGRRYLATRGPDNKLASSTFFMPTIIKIKWH